MALKFICKKCSADIVVKFLKSGEVAECKRCGFKNVVQKQQLKQKKNLIIHERRILRANR